ncbi:MAG: hypothetical protein RIS69_1755 [Actinomycetota bacterium]
MQDVAAMPELLGTFLTKESGQTATVTSYEAMTGGYSRLMARADASWLVLKFVGKTAPPKPWSCAATRLQVRR